MNKNLAMLVPALLTIVMSQGAPVRAQTPQTPASASVVVVKPFDVFVDPPTRFVFLKLPAGWKFVGALSEAEMRSLPAGVLTSLLPVEPERQARQ